MFCNHKLTLSLVSGWLLASCSGSSTNSGEPPIAPSWQTDVMPILSNRCVRCHGAIVSGGAPPTIRLDSYGPVPRADGTALAGASSAALQIFKRVSGIGLLRNDLKMPPSGDIEQYEITVLRNWAALSDGNGTAPRGAGNSGNSIPTATLTEKSRTPTTVTFSAKVQDADDDLVILTLIGPVKNGQQVEQGVVGSTIAGETDVTINIENLAPGMYPLIARVDDGSDVDGVDGVADYTDIALPMLSVP
jgi:hypothetical protein